MMDLNHSAMFCLKLAVNMGIYKFKQLRSVINETKIIETSYGKIRGIKRENPYGDGYSYFSFEGIPYAKPPLGELRFRAPQPPDPWQNVLDCRQYKEKPAQFQIIFKIREGAEDCLHLNVYSKMSSPNKKLPVMVWIYGGGFLYGEADREVYSPEYFMQHDVVVVTFNYRLGVFGFLCFDSPEVNVPGNAGLKDQMMALKWVQENIHHFNGDANNVTVFGESAGAVSAQMLMLSPRAEGLFHKAILQSGSVLSHWAYTDRHHWGHKLARCMGYMGEYNDIDVYNFLVKQDAKNFLGLDKFILEKSDLLLHNLFSAFVPVIEPYETKDAILCRPFEEVLPTAWSNKIPLIIGGNSHEGLFGHNLIFNYPFLIEELKDINCTSFLPYDIKGSYTEDQLKEMGQELLKMYFGDAEPTIKDHGNQYFELMGDHYFWVPIHRIIRARCLYAPDVPTYCYRFEFDSPTFNHARSLFCVDQTIRGACHADEVSYLFGNLIAAKLQPHEKEYTCMRRMTGMWCNFALNSNPNCKEIAPTVWKSVDDPDKPIQCLVINENVKFTTLPTMDRLEKWKKFYEKVTPF